MRENARRICLATHAHPTCVVAAETLAECLARLLQGDPLEAALECAADRCVPLSSLAAILPAQLSFSASLAAVVMRGGEACVAGQVAGAVLGATAGYGGLPAELLDSIDNDFRVSMDRKINKLLDLMGVP